MSKTPQSELKETEYIDTPEKVETYQISRATAPRRVRGPNKIKEKFLEIPVEVIPKAEISLTDKGAEISYSKAKELKPKRELTQKQKDAWQKVLESNKEKRLAFKADEEERKYEADLERAQKLLEENKVRVTVKPKVAKPNPNHPLRSREKIVKEIEEKVSQTIQKIKEVEKPVIKVVPPPPVIKENPYLIMLRKTMR
jgi:hypothetical protein